MNYTYTLSKDLAMIFATLFLGSSFLLKVVDSVHFVILYAIITLSITLISIVFMVIFRNEKQV